MSRATHGSFATKTLPNGKPNMKYVDLLTEEDAPIPGQRYVVSSFISPEKILKKRETFLFEEFVRQWEYTRSVKTFSDFLNFLSFKYNLSVDGLQEDFKSFLTDEKAKLMADLTVEDDYKTFLDAKEKDLSARFNSEHAFQTSVRGFMFRGAFDTVEEANRHCKELQKINADHDIFVGTGFVWQMWHPDAYKTGDVQFLEEELNQLYHEKVINEKKAKQEFENRIKESKKKAIEENIENAKKSGNVLTQTMDADGNLIGVRDTINFEERDVASDASRDAKRGDANIATDANKIQDELYHRALADAEKDSIDHLVD